VLKINAYEKKEKLNEKDFKLITGARREAFNKALKTLKVKYSQEHKQGGQPGMPVELRLTLALEYWREYRSLRHMANGHQISKTQINRAILWVEDILSESEEFKLKGLKERFKPGEEPEIQVIVADVEEQPIKRPKYGQKSSYSGKKNVTQRNIKP
jgi:hypothetical protein